MRRQNPLPPAVDGLIEERIGNELLVYHPATARAHNLNESCAWVFGACKRGISLREAIERLGSERGMSETCAHRIVSEALKRLLQAGLIQPGDQLPRGSCRRELLKAASLGVLAPAIVSLFAPLPASAASTIPNGICKNLKNQPCPGTRCTGGGGGAKFCKGPINECECRD